MWSDTIMIGNEEYHVEDVDSNRANLEVELWHAWRRIGLALKRFLDLPIEGHEMLVAAAVIYNPYGKTGATWENLGKEYGATRSKEALILLDEGREILQQIQVDEGAGNAIEANARDRVLYRIKEASGPIWSHVKGIVYSDDIDIERILDLLFCYHQGCIEEELGSRGKFRAYRTAVALRAVFEVYSTKAITAGDYNVKSDTTTCMPSGDFCSCLEEIFSISKVDGGFRHFAKQAKDLAEDNELLCDLKSDLIQGALHISEHQEILSFTES